MWEAVLPLQHLKDAIRQFVHPVPMSFVALLRVLPQLRGQDDFKMNNSITLWRGLSPEGIEALNNLHEVGAIFFWLCSPDIYTRTGDAPVLPLASRSIRIGDCPWLPTLIHDRAPTTAQNREAVRQYVADLAKYSTRSLIRRSRGGS